IGATIFFLIELWFGTAGVWYLIVLGLTAMLFSLFLPKGIWGYIEDRFHVLLLPVGYRVRLLQPAAGGTTINPSASPPLQYCERDNLFAAQTSAGAPVPLAGPLIRCNRATMARMLELSATAGTTDAKHRDKSDARRACCCKDDKECTRRLSPRERRWKGRG